MLYYFQKKVDKIPIRPRALYHVEFLCCTILREMKKRKLDRTACINHIMSLCSILSLGSAAAPL